MGPTLRLVVVLAAVVAVLASGFLGKVGLAIALIVLTGLLADLLLAPRS